MSAYAKVKVFSLLKGIGNSIFNMNEVRMLFSDLLVRRSRMLKGKPCQSLSSAEIEIVCILLEACLLVSNSTIIDSDLVKNLFMSLKVEDSFLDEPAVSQPCLTALQNVSCDFYSNLKDNMQEELFCYLVLLFHNENADVRDAAKEALLRIKVSYTTVLKLLDAIIAKGHDAGSFKRMKKDNFIQTYTFFPGDLGGGRLLAILNSVLEILLLKKNMENRQLLVEMLFNLLRELFSGKWIHNISGLDKQRADSPADTSLINDAATAAQQTALIILGDICASFISDISEKIEVSRQFNIDLLIECARSTPNFMTRNHIFLLLCAFAKFSSDRIFDHMLDLFGIIGEAATKQYDNHSQQVLEALISTLVPCWLSKTDSTKGLLEVFLEALPRIEEHRRLKLTVYLLRTLGEKSSLGNFLALMFRSLVLRKIGSFNSDISINGASFSVSKYKEWEYVFAEEICGQFSCSIWLPCLVTFWEEIGKDIEFNGGCFELLLALQFILEKLQDTELYFEIESGKTPDHQVLMQTRNEKIRPRILGLRVVKFLMEHLKEEYLVLLPETIPFLSELLEDVEHSVKSLAQEIFKELETLSGENLKQYL